MPNVNLNLYMIRIEFGTNSLIWTHCKKMSAKYVYLEEWELFSHLKKKGCLKTLNTKSHITKLPSIHWDQIVISAPNS